MEMQEVKNRILELEKEKEKLNNELNTLKSQLEVTGNEIFNITRGPKIQEILDEYKKDIEEYSFTITDRSFTVLFSDNNGNPYKLVQLSSVLYSEKAYLQYIEEIIINITKPQFKKKLKIIREIISNSELTNKLHITIDLNEDSNINRIKTLSWPTHIGEISLTFERESLENGVVDYEFSKWVEFNQEKIGIELPSLKTITNMNFSLKSAIGPKNILGKGAFKFTGLNNTISSEHLINSILTVIKEFENANSITFK